MNGPSRKQLESAVRLAQLYQGAFEFSPIRDQERLYRRLLAIVGRIADAADISTTDAFEQVTREARRRGSIRPTPGKDI